MKPSAFLILCSLLFTFLFSGCNLYGGLSSPSDDEQNLIAARSAQDNGDYATALKCYQALSNSYSDVKIGEEGLNSLAQGNIFSISDLVSSLGTAVGSSASFSILAEALEQRGITAASYRGTILTVYQSDNAIANAQLKAFNQFIVSLAMFNEVLANAVGSDGILTASDIVVDPTTCKSSTGTNGAACAAPSGTQLIYTAGASEPIDFTSSAEAWEGQASIVKLGKAATEVGNDYENFSGHSLDTGIFTVISQFSNLPGTEGPARYALIEALDL
jgi:hypothetical protein